MPPQLTRISSRPRIAVKGIVYTVLYAMPATHSAVILTPIVPADERPLRNALPRRGRERADDSIPCPGSPAETKAWLDAAIAEASRGKALVFALRNQNGGMAGSCRLSGFDYEYQSGHISYWVAPNSRGRGYAVSSVRLTSRFAFEYLGLERIVTAVHEDNAASRAVLQRAGFSLTRPERTPAPLDCVYYAELDASRAGQAPHQQVPSSILLTDNDCALTIRPTQAQAFRDAALRLLGRTYAREFIAGLIDRPRGYPAKEVVRHVVDAVLRGWSIGLRGRGLRAIAFHGFTLGPHGPAPRLDLAPGPALDAMLGIENPADWHKRDGAGRESEKTEAAGY